MIRKKYIPVLFTLLLAASYCRQAEPKNEEAKEEKNSKNKQTSSEQNSSPPGYDLNHPAKLNLKPELDEISGITYYPKDTCVFAISDDKGWLYKIHLTAQLTVEKWKFAKGEDFEDVVLADSTFYVLASNGQITSFKFENNTVSVFNTYSINKEGVNEFETLYNDPQSGKLVMICKDCEEDPKKEVSAYSIDPVEKSFSDTPFFTLKTGDLAKKGETKKMFKPSAACINPLTKELYVLSSVNKALAIADQSGNIKTIYHLDPKIYKQPEGLTFTPAGDLLISNESADIGAANILIFKFKK